MSPIDSDIVQRKLKLIVENLVEIEAIYAQGWPHYEKTKNTRKLAERYLQETIEAASDLNAHILSETGKSTGDDYYEGFIKMGEAGFISFELAKELAPCSSLRNRIVHEYEELDHKQVFQGLKKSMDLFPQYIKKLKAL